MEGEIIFEIIFRSCVSILKLIIYHNNLVKCSIPQSLLPHQPKKTERKSNLKMVHA